MAAITVTALVPGTKPLPSRKPQRGLRGAFMNLPYVGPARIDDGADHATGIEDPTKGGGGAVTTDGYRQSDSFGVQKLLGDVGGEIEDVGLSSADGAGQHTLARASRFRQPAGAATPPAYIADGIEGGSTQSTGTTAVPVGGVFDTTGRAVDTGLDRFGRTKGVANAGAGLGTYHYTNASRKKSTMSGSAVALGDATRTISTGTNQPDSVEGDTVAVAAKYVGTPRLAPGAGSTAVGTITPTLTAPLLGSVGDGTIGLVDGGAAIDVDLHANDITGGSNDRAGAVLAIYKRSADDTDEDGPLLAFCSIDGGTDATEAVGAAGIGAAALATGTYRVYARWRYPRPAASGGGYEYSPLAIGTIAVA